ncbi:hypothetical protein QBZ16_001431 [Prototheca wickerhamii]|uniref:diphthine methyl ester synthase n=1 Tax=Prototheca wickerhamii TaxID=3111 RepID=A0AAD9MJ67_PROWI|nr:hypothetical protein QBZ16_001431 [Prototheca wickerhamii]
MVLYFVGLGLADERDITVKGLEVVKRAARVYLEAYTSILLVPKEQLEAFYERPVIVADREMVEMEADKILEGAANEDVAFLVVGDPYGATTHTDLELRALDLGIPVKTIHNASIMNAVGAAGLQLYRYGETISIVFFTETWRPDSFYDRIVANKKMGLHTLCLLDIKVKEPSLEALCRGKKIYEPPRYMSVNTAVEQLLEIEEKRGEGVCGPDARAVGVARLGADDQLIVAGTLEELRGQDFGAPLHSLILAGEMHHIELDAWERHRAAGRDA